MRNTMIRSALLFVGGLLTSAVAFAQHIEKTSYNNETEIRATGSVTLKPGFHIPAGKTVRIFTGASFISFPAFAVTPSADQNYVSTTLYKKATTDGNISGWNAGEVNRSIQYLDGLGRPLQNVQGQASPGFRDIVTPVVYDGYGREVMKYNPYPAQTGTNGQFRTNAISDQSNFFNSPTAGVKSTAFPYAETRLESSPLSRLLEQGAPGATWQIGQGHTIRMNYESNVAGEVRQWRLTATGAVSDSTYYPGRLQKTVTKDENWVPSDLKAGTTEEFKDFEGKIVLKRNWETNIKSLSTYYIYDDFGNVVYVVPPAINENGRTLLSFHETDTEFDQYIYAYKYDQRNRVVEKKFPGKGWEYMVYNKLDQLVASQDGLQRLKPGGQWLYTKYDAVGRVTSTGFYASASSRSALQTDQDNISPGTPLWETRTTGEYSNDRFPTTNTTPLTVNYYDDYLYQGALDTVTKAGEVRDQRTKTLLTGTKIFRVDGTAPLMTSNYYDKEGQLVRSKAQNHLNGTDEVINTYSFVGELTNSTRTHIANGQTTTIAMRYEYDHAGRKIATMQSINGQPEVALSKLDYNEIGQLKTKNLHATDAINFVQNTEYAYNERGWLKSINDPGAIGAKKAFGMTLDYANKADAYNGNIGAVSWRTKVPAGLGLSEDLQSYTYNYDKLNRLEKAGYTTLGQENKYNEELSYDLMGNILRLKRTKGTTANFNDLSYNYTQSGQSGNRLYGVTDGGSGGQTSSYTYDVNGNQVTNSKLGITSIGYNYLNLPQSITKASTNATLNYTYDAVGSKLKKQFGSQVTDYVGGIQYTNNSIDFIQTEEGRAIRGSSYTYEYFLKDHLGNTRAVVKQDGTITQVQDYYAFGLEMNPGNQFAGSPANRYTYNGKEKQVELDLNQLDYGARFYDPVIGRWNVVDPLANAAEQIDKSPYAYGWNNPVKYTDPDGRCPECEEKFKKPQEGQIYTTSGGSSYIYSGGTWTRQGGDLEEVNIKPDGFYAFKPYAYSTEERGVFGAYSIGYNKRGESGEINMDLTGFSGEAHADDTGVGVSGTALKALVAAKVEVGEVGGSGKISGKLLHAEANLDGGMNIFKNGKTGLTGEATAGAYGGVASVEGDLKIGPIVLSGKQSTSFGSAHIGGNGGAYYDHTKGAIVLQVGWNIGLGAGTATQMKMEFKVR